MTWLFAGGIYPAVTGIPFSIEIRQAMTALVPSSSLRYSMFRVLVVTYTGRGKQTRLINARIATRTERIKYEEEKNF